MCGRFTLRAPASVIVEEFQLSLAPDWSPRYNIAPTQPVLVAITDGASGRIAKRMSWGLIPSWAKDRSIASSLINARGETVVEKPSFRAAFSRRRCLVLTDGYYEWQKQGHPTERRPKQPFHIHRPDQRPFAMAGLWETWGDDHLETCTVITTASNETTRAIHDRMPVVLAPQDYEIWLDTADYDREKLVSLLQPAPADLLLTDRVSTYVNFVRHDDPQCLASEPSLF